MSLAAQAFPNDFSVGDATGPSLWPVTQKWSWKMEQEYSQWVRENLTPDFYIKYQVPTVCVDVVYTLRWIFAREHGLPAANTIYEMVERSNGQKEKVYRLFTNYSRFPNDHLPTAPEWNKDRRFLAALDYLVHHANSPLLWTDSYPIAINNESLLPGAYHINKDANVAHTMIIWQVNHDPDEIPVITLSSTEPRIVRPLNQYMYVETQADPHHLAILRMRWPIVSNEHQIYLQARPLMPYFSMEQFDRSFAQAPRHDFWQEIFHRVDPQVNFAPLAMESLVQIEKMLAIRKTTVDQGYEFCKQHGPCREGTKEWDDWSTPGLDARIKGNISVFEQLRDNVEDHEALDIELKRIFVLGDGLYLSLGDLIDHFTDDDDDRQKYSSNPNDDMFKRWGFTQPQKIQSKNP